MKTLPSSGGPPSSPPCRLKEAFHPTTVRSLCTCGYHELCDGADLGRAEDGSRDLNVGIVLSGELAVANCWAGIIVYGMVRDAPGFVLGVLAVGSSPRRTGGTNRWVLDAPVIFGNVTFESGRSVWCDADGIVTQARGLQPS